MKAAISKKGVKQDRAIPFFTAELEREDDGRWIAEIPALPGVMSYGPTKQGALRRAYAVALRTFTDM